MNIYVKKALVSLSTSLLVLSISACGGSETETPTAPATPKVKKLQESETVQTAFDMFNDFNFTDGNETALINDLKYTLKNPVNGETSADIATSIALIELFELSNDPVISKYFTISIKDYPTLVSSLTEYSDSNDVNSLLDEDITNALSSFDLGSLIGKGFSYDLPEPAHKAAQKFKNLSDALKKSFPDESYVFRYWPTDDFNGNVAKYLRVGLLTSASMLELISSYSYGVADDYGTADNNYTEVLYDPVTILNNQQIFIFDPANSDSITRLENAKALLIEAMTLSKEVDINELPESDIDYRTSRAEIDKVLRNLTASDGTKTTYKYDLGSGKPYMYINFQSLFDPNTAIDITDFGTDAFIYECGTASYDITLSEANASRPICSDGSAAKVFLDVNVANGMRDDDTNFDELVVKMTILGINVGLSTKSLMKNLFETINDEVK